MKISPATQSEIAQAGCALLQAQRDPRAASYWLMQSMHHCHQAAATHHAAQTRAGAGTARPRKTKHAHDQSH